MLYQKYNLNKNVLILYSLIKKLQKKDKIIKQNNWKCN